MSNGQYAAALVLAADNSNIEYGTNLIGVLDYLSPEKPPTEVFRRRNWFFRNHHGWNNVMHLGWYQYVGFRSIKDRVEIVGRVEVLDSDPKDSNSYCPWSSIGEQVLMQCASGTRIALDGPTNNASHLTGPVTTSLASSFHLRGAA